MLLYQPAYICRRARRLDFDADERSAPPLFAALSILTFMRRGSSDSCPDSAAATGRSDQQRYCH